MDFSLYTEKEINGNSSPSASEDIPLAVVVESNESLELSKEAQASVVVEDSSSVVTKPTSILRARSKYEEDTLAQRPEVCSPHVRKSRSSRRLVWPDEDEELVTVTPITPYYSRFFFNRNPTDEEWRSLARRNREADDAYNEYVEELFHLRRPFASSILPEETITVTDISEERKKSFCESLVDGLFTKGTDLNNFLMVVLVFLGIIFMFYLFQSILALKSSYSN